MKKILPLIVILVLVAVLIMVISFVGCGNTVTPSEVASDGYTITANNRTGAQTFVSEMWHADSYPVSTVESGDSMSIEFINVGQADCSLICTGDKTMLIDGGNNADGTYLVDYLQSKGIERIDYMVATHAHEDHIGGLDDIIYAFDVDNIIMPIYAADSDTYYDFEQAVIYENANIIEPEPGTSYNLNNAVFTIVGAETTPEKDINSSSTVIRLAFGEFSCLFAGDITSHVEQKLLSSGNNLAVDVLKVAHHGSNTSSSNWFVSKCTPQVAIISVGEDNGYGLPDTEVIERYLSWGAQVMRTDELGTIRAEINDVGVVSFSACQTNTDSRRKS